MLRLVIIATLGLASSAAFSTGWAVDELYVVREPSAITAEADRHFTGDGAMQDDARALELYRQAAEMGDPRAMYFVGVMYAEGRGGVPQDDVVAANYYRDAVGHSYGPAMASLGMAYAEGRGVPLEPRTAYTLLKKAADAGDTKARDYIIRAKLRP